MATVDNIIAQVVAVLKAEPSLAGVNEWQEVNSLLSLKSPGVSVGLEKESFEPYDREYDNAKATIKILVWVKVSDPVQGEAQVRSLAYAVRSVLSRETSLGGLIDMGFVNSIEYLSGDTGKGVLLHLAELDYLADYLAPRAEAVPGEIINEVSMDLE